MLGAAQAGRRSSLKLLSVLTDEDLIVAGPARRPPTWSTPTRRWPAIPALAARWPRWSDAEQAEYLEKA